MAITFVNFSGAAFVGATSSTTAMPAAIQANDVIVSHFYTQSADIHSSLAVGGTGWHLLGAVYGNGTTYAVAYCVANGSGQGGPQWSWTGAATGGANTNAFRGVYTSGATPLGVNFDITTGSGTTGALPSINTTSANGNVYYNLMTFTSQTVPTPSGYSADVIYTSTLPDVTEARKTVATPGASGGISVSLTSTTWVGALIELLGAAPPTTESGTIAQTLKLVTQSVAGAMWAKGTVAQTLKTITQALNGAEWATGAVTQTLGKISEHVTAFESEMFGTITQTLGNVKETAHGWVEEIGQIVQTLGQMKQSLTGHGQLTAEEIGGIIITLIHPLTQQARGWMEPMGTIVQTLQGARQTLGGWAEATGHVTQVLQPITQVLNGVELTLLSLYYVSVDQLNAIVAKIERQIRKTWHGPPDDPLSPVS